MRVRAMKEEVLRNRLKELYLPPTDRFVRVDVPDMRFVMIDGKGAADRSALDHAAKWLFTLIHPIKRIARERMGKNFVEPPLECLWWADDMKDFVCGNKDKLNWRMMIVFEPDWLTAAVFDDCVEKARDRLGEPPASLKLDTHREGLCVQIMHVGPPSALAATIARMHQEFLPANRLIACGRHHEIYLNDPNRVAPEKLKTVLRQPVRASR